nr:MAG TPA: hypothetical protein [Caudoviricetes sp.]
MLYCNPSNLAWVCAFNLKQLLGKGNSVLFKKKSPLIALDSKRTFGRVHHKILYLYCNRNRRKNNEKHE